MRVLNSKGLQGHTPSSRSVVITNLMTGDISFGFDSIMMREQVRQGVGGWGGGGERECKGGDYLLLGPHTEGTLSLVLRGREWKRISIFPRIEPPILQNIEQYHNTVQHILCNPILTSSDKSLLT